MDGNIYDRILDSLTIAVDTDKLRAYSKQLNGVSKKISNQGSRIKSLVSNSNSTIAIRLLNEGNATISKCKKYLDFAAEALDDTETYLSKLNPSALGFGLSSICVPGSLTVSKLAKNAEKIMHPPKGKTIVSGSAKHSTFVGKSMGRAFGEVQPTSENDYLYMVSSYKKWGEYTKGYEPRDLVKKAIEKNGDKKKKGKSFEFETDIQLFSKSDSIEKSVKSFGKDADWWDLNFAKRENHYSVDGGYSSKKGWYVKAEAGSSFSLLSGSLSKKLGNEVLGGHGSVNAEIGTVSEGGELSFGTKEGLKASLNLEANLVKVSATTGITVFGVDSEATASVKVGVGFHAKAEVKKGVITCEFGAAFGLGFDVSIKVDVRKPVKAVKKAAKAAWKKFKKLF
ncbi:MAG: hypothetical protein KBT07_06785 [Clostridiales bacterium]|nr:hypothetical protein [Candidatus Scatonaster coprocaballi]